MEQLKTGKTWLWPFLLRLQMVAHNWVSAAQTPGAKPLVSTLQGCCLGNATWHKARAIKLVL